jgi:alkylation response protein AidB-like acyl-CoA dehydrogenase
VVIDLIVVDELARCAAGGVLAGVFVSLAIALPCILMAASDEIKGRVVEDALAGKKRMCLAITEPYGGSDVASVRTTAVKATDEDGEHYIVSGEKKFITGGCSADFLVVAVRTSDNGYFGISLLLLEKGRC